MTLKTEREQLQKEVTKLRRENTRLANANVKLNTTISKMATDAAAGSDWEKRWGEARSEMSDITRSKNKIVEQHSALANENSKLCSRVTQHEALLRDIQRDMRTACELMYGQDFDPSNIDRLMPMMSGGVEYVPRVNGETVGGYVEPAQRLIRMIWRHTHWGLNPINQDRSINHGYYGESPYSR